MRELVLLAVLAACNGGSKQSVDPPPPDPTATIGCRTDDDCVVSCAVKGDCCLFGYCETVQTKAAADEASRGFSSCTTEDFEACPRILFGHLMPAYRVVPRCRANTCVAEKQPVTAAAPYGLFDISVFETACKTAADCTLVHDSPCGPCKCNDTPIAVRDHDRYSTSAGGVTCPREEGYYNCVICPERAPACVSGTCK